MMSKSNFVLERPENKKPGVERRVRPSNPDYSRRVTVSREARLMFTPYS